MGGRLKAGCTLLILLTLINGCAGTAPVYDIGGKRAERAPTTYVVRKGDTLYSIAFRYGLDFRSLAATNRISAPYTIFVDQRLVVSGAAPRAQKDDGPVTAKTTPQKAKATVNQPARNTKPVVTDAPVFRWPLTGEILGGFSLNGSAQQKVNKGIDIAGKPGARISAAAAGIVVYAGGNLRGYGKLLIVKHNDKYLTAYGNNEKLLVKEGQRVAAGEAIATVGANVANTNLLHFEIRQDGKPVNPLDYLPAR